MIPVYRQAFGLQARHQRLAKPLLGRAGDELGQVGGGGVLHQRIGALHRAAIRFLAWRARRETVRLLNAVDPATLRDLGIADVESQVYRAPEERRRPYDPDWWRRRK